MLEKKEEMQHRCIVCLILSLRKYLLFERMRRMRYLACSITYQICSFFSHKMVFFGGPRKLSWQVRVARLQTKKVVTVNLHFELFTAFKMSQRCSKWLSLRVQMSQNSSLLIGVSTNSFPRLPECIDLIKPHLYKIPLLPSCTTTHKSPLPAFRSLFPLSNTKGIAAK